MENIKIIAERVENVKNEIKKSEKDLEKLNKEISELKYNKDKHEEVKGGFDYLKDQLSKLETTKNIQNADLTKKQEEQKKIVALIDKLREKLKKFEKILKFLNILGEIRTSFSKDGIQRFLREKLAPIITEITREYLDSFNLDITDISVDEDFNISLFGRSGEISVKSISGGEKVAVAIALRLAIGQAIAGRVSTIIMDEPTTHLDEERRRELVKIMNNFLREKSSVPQIIIVTHHHELEDLADTIYRVKKVDNISTIKELSY